MAEIKIDVQEDSEEIREWKKQASQLQTSFYGTYHDKIWWSGIPDMSNKNKLQHIIGQIIYGHPTNEGQEDLKTSGYKRKEIFQIKFIFKRIMKHFKNEASISVILICAKLKNTSHTEQVFRVWDAEKEYFIDAAGRVYKNWDAFLNENMYLKCLICYPAFGIYKLNVRDEVLVDYIFTPACSSKRQLLFKLDIVFLIIAFIGLILMIAAVITQSTIIYIVAFVVIIIGWPFRGYRLYNQLRDTCKHL